MAKSIHREICLLFIGSIFLPRIGYAQVDADVTEKTMVLYDNLKHLQNSSQFLFGQEFFNSFRYTSGSAHGEKEYSDSKSVTGSHPAVLGSDFHYYLEKDDTERSYHTEAVKWAYRQGYVITFDWHLSGRGTTTYEYQSASKDLVNNIVNDLNGDRTWYLGEVDKVIDIINNELIVDTERITIVFRPLHEMNGGWFWWGSQATTPANYIELYRMLVTYIKERTNTVLFCWSPNAPVNFNYYPGDEYVDVLGVDAYEANAMTVRSELAPIVDHAQANEKVAIFSETGYRLDDGTTAGDNARSAYWKHTILPAIIDDPAQKAQKIAWVLTWINASWSFPYVPHSNSSQEAKQNFVDFKESPYVLFGDEAPDMYSPIPIVSVEEDAQAGVSVTIYPVPVNDKMTVSLLGFDPNSMASIYDLQGKLLQERRVDAETVIFDCNGILGSGVYILKVADSRKVISKKLLVH
jgi:mannan endo-1,4-beta-mannosidase